VLTKDQRLSTKRECFGIILALTLGAKGGKKRGDGGYVAQEETYI
jgi:hypothetical protein